MNKDERFRYFTIDELKDKAKAEPSIWNGAMRDFCETFDKAWQPFRYKDSALVLYSFQPGSLRYITVHVRIGALTLAQSFDWMYLSEPMAAFDLAFQAAKMMRENIYSKLQDIGLQVAQANSVEPMPAHHIVTVPEETFDKILTGDISAVPGNAGEAFRKGDVLRMFRQRRLSASFYDGPPEPESYESIDVKFTGYIPGIICFEPVKVSAAA